MDTAALDVPTGEALERARRAVRCSHESAAAYLGISTRALADFESGMRTPSQDILRSMASLYDTNFESDTTRQWASRSDAQFDNDTATLWIGLTCIRVGGMSNEELCCSVSTAIRSVRQASASETVHLRSGEKPQLARLFDLRDEALPDLLMEHFCISPSDALVLVSEMVVIASVHA